MLTDKERQEMLDAKYNPKVYKELVSSVVSIMGDHLVSIILFGSVARGEADWESDIDIAIIYKEIIQDEKVAVQDKRVDIGLEYNVFISLIWLSQEQVEHWTGCHPFFNNLKKEGKVLWPTLVSSL